MTICSEVSRPPTEPKVIGSNPIGCTAFGAPQRWGRVIDESVEDDPEFCDRRMMRRALELARDAMDLGEVPVGSIVVREGRILSQAHNLRETWNDPTAHAERVAMTLAGRALGSWRLENCTLYVTLEPCPMCAGAIVQGRIARVVYGAADPKAGACGSLYRLADDPRFNHRDKIKGGVLAEECGALLSTFFQERRPNRPRLS